MWVTAAETGTSGSNARAEPAATFATSTPRAFSTRKEPVSAATRTRLLFSSPTWPVEIPRSGRILNPSASR
jgi:hypothetical protein